MGNSAQNNFCTLVTSGALNSGCPTFTYYSSPAKAYITNGNVGIGTASPQGLLHVLGNMRLQDPNRATYSVFDNGGGNIGYSIRTQGGGGWAWQFVDGANVPYFNVDFPTGNLTTKGGATFNGNVGIGIATPSTSVRLHVKESGASTSTWRGRIVASGDNKAVVLGEINSQAWLGAHNAALTAWDDLYIQADAGNIAIGSRNTPQAKLHLSTSSISSSPLKLQSTAGGATVGIDFLTYGGGDNTGAVARISAIDASGNKGALAFYTNKNGGMNSNAVVEQMRIDNNGNVGIGTSSPSAMLEVNGTIQVDGSSIFKNKVSIGTKSNSNTDALLAVYGTFYSTKSVVTQGSWADDEFLETTLSPSLSEEETITKSEHHLMGVPNEKEIAEKGLDMGEMQAIQMRKIEQVYKHLFALSKENAALKAEIEALKAKK